MQLSRAALACTLGLFACGDKGSVDSAGALDDALAAELWEEIQGYESWSQVDPWTGVQTSSDGTHGPYVEIWVNAAHEGSYGDASAAEGSIAVKKGHDAEDGSAPRGFITVMWKNAEAGTDDGWFWARYDDDGTLDVAGALDMCTGCHSAGSDMRRMVTDTPGGA
ncbi:MAG: cytochrome P460 family protein [Alphaproteobacteria bacterium]|nr:cytochrome P460 family protein [Alphaproteobacteria bacterium]MCB9797763.1 cytochrome P460 family protein [Alphaproteobacteria bacterium]